MIDHLNRRDILKRFPAAAAALLAAHELFAQEMLDAPREKKIKGFANQPLIRGLRLLTGVPLAEMRRFYCDKIGFKYAEERDGEFTFHAGATRVTFVKAQPDQFKGNGGRGNGEPMYHFAFNIPSNKILAARKWQLERSSLVSPRREVRDSGMPGDVWHFRHWNAHSVFFFDPAWNIVEYIARHDLKNEAADEQKFGVSDILYASEIGYVTNRADQKKTIALMRDQLGLHEYPRGAEPWAMGDERGLLLCLARLGEQWAEHTETPVNWGVFPTECTVRGPKPGTYKVDGFPYSVRAE